MFEHLHQILTLSDALRFALSYLNIILCLLAFASIIYGAFLLQRISVLKRFNDGNANDLRIELVKRRARRICCTSFALALALGTGYTVAGVYKIAAMFFALAAVSIFSAMRHKANEKLLDQALSAKSKKKRKTAAREKSTNIVSVNLSAHAPGKSKDNLFDIAKDLFTQYQISREPKANNSDVPESYRIQNQIQKQHEREQSVNKKSSDDILDSDLIG